MLRSLCVSDPFQNGEKKEEPEEPSRRPEKEATDGEPAKDAAESADGAAKAEPAKDGGRNRGFESAARFINMHVAHGVAEENIRVAVVVHGKAVHDLLSAEGWAVHDLEGENDSALMVRAMLDQGVRFIVCGQSAAAYGVTRDELIEGVEMDLSAMTAHAKLQQRGYTVNPF